MKQIYLLAAALAVTLSANAEAPEGYYYTLNGKNKAELKEAAKQRVRAHTVVSYGDATWEAFAKTDVRMVDGELCWWDMYSNNNVAVSSGHTGLNIEHSVANSWWGKTKNDAYKDLFHLNPSDAEANNRKSNYPLGVVVTSIYDNGITLVGYPATGDCGGASKVYEPADCYKGDFARAFMYVFTVYDDIEWMVDSDDRNFMFDGSAYPSFRPWAVDLLLEWSRLDPVDQKEIDRNDAIYEIQKNRNPFIDHPELAEYIWGDKQDELFVVEGGPGEDPVDPMADVVMTCDFDSSSNISSYEAAGWERAGSTDFWSIKTFSGNNYACATAYNKTGEGEAPYSGELITPEFTIPEGYTGVLTFSTQGAYRSDDCSLEVYMVDGNGTRTRLNAEICVPNDRGASSVYSSWVASGETELPSGPMRIAFVYNSLECGASQNTATYCVDDIKVVKRASSGIRATDRRLQPTVYTYGRNLYISAYGTEATCAEIYDGSGRRVAATGLNPDATLSLAPGFYIVTFDAGMRPVKIRF